MMGQLGERERKTASDGRNRAASGSGRQIPSSSSAPSVSLVEPGPVATEFEGKLMEQVSTAEFPGTDPDTLRYFRDSYLPASRELFRNVGQSPQDVVQVSGGPRAPRHSLGM